MLFEVITHEHVIAQGTVAREQVSTQYTLSCEHISTQGTIAREQVSTQGALEVEYVSTQVTLAKGAREDARLVGT